MTREYASLHAGKTHTMMERLVFARMDSTLLQENVVNALRQSIMTTSKDFASPYANSTVTTTMEDVIAILATISSMVTAKNALTELSTAPETKNVIASVWKIKSTVLKAVFARMGTIESMESVVGAHIRDLMIPSQRHVCASLEKK